MPKAAYEKNRDLKLLAKEVDTGKVPGSAKLGLGTQAEVPAADGRKEVVWRYRLVAEGSVLSFTRLDDEGQPTGEKGSSATPAPGTESKKDGLPLSVRWVVVGTALSLAAFLLTGLADADEASEREALADLGSRLAALVRHLSDAGVDEALLAPLRDLLGELEADRPLRVPAEGFAELWARTLATADGVPAAAGRGATGIRATSARRSTSSRSDSPTGSSRSSTSSSGRRIACRSTSIR